MILVTLRDSGRTLEVGKFCGKAVRLLNALLQLAHGGEILVELPAVGRAEVRLQASRIFHGEIQHALAVTVALDPRFIHLARVAVAKKPIKHLTRINFWRHGRGFAFPRDVVGIRAAITGVTIAGQPRLVRAEFQRGQPGAVANLLQPRGGTTHGPSRYCTRYLVR